MKDTATQAPADAAATATAPRPETETTPAVEDAPAGESAYIVDGEAFDADEIRRMIDPAAPFDARLFNRASRAFGFAAVPDGSAYANDAWREIREAHDAPLGCGPVLSAAGAAFAHWMRGAIRVREAYRAAMDACATDADRAAWRVEALSAECCARSTANARFSLGVPVMPADAPQGAEAPEPEPAPEPAPEPGVTLSAREAAEIAAWLRLHLAAGCADDTGDGPELDAESLLSLSRWICRLERAPGLDAGRD